MFLERWLKKLTGGRDRSQPESSKSEARPRASADPERPAARLDPARPAPRPAPQPAPQRVPKKPAGRRERWFEEADIVALKGLTDDKQIAQVISRKPPGASREEVLFRYYLSRAVFVGEFELPVLPQTAAQVIELGRRPRAEISEYARIVESDPSVVKAVIDVANSSFFSSLSEVPGLDQAIVRIGLRQLERIVLLHALNSRVFRVRGYEKALQQLVVHSLATGIGAQAVAATGNAPAADAFLGGLFHDLGKFVLVRIVGDVQNKLRWAANPRLLDDAFGAFHVRIGESICRHWSFPPLICDAVGAHQSGPEAADGGPLHRAVYLGNKLAHVVIDGSAMEQEFPPDDPVVAAERLGTDEIELLIGTLTHEARAFEALGIGSPTPTPTPA